MPQTVFRVENPRARHGLWYNYDGTYNGFVHNQMQDAMLRDLPMGYDPNMRKDGLAWRSAADSMEQLLNWVSPEDAVQLEAAGFELAVYTVHFYREVPGHVVFIDGAVISRVVVPFATLTK